MNEKNKMILSYLKSNETYTQSSALAKYLNVSERTIKRYIKSINADLEKHGARIDSTKGLGYKLLIFSNEDFNKYLSKNTGISEKKSSITIDLLINILKDYPVKLDSIATKLYTSRSTLQAELSNIRDLLDEYKINLQYKPYTGLYLEGKEEDIRKCYIRYLFKEDSPNEIKLYTELGDINNDLIAVLKKYIERKIIEKKIDKNDYEIEYLTKFIAVSCFRSKLNHNLDKSLSENKNYEGVFGDEFNNLLEEIFKVRLSDDEINYINVLIKSDDKNSTDETINKDKIKKLISESIRQIDIRYKSFLNEDSLLISSLTNHILNSYHRYNLNIDVENIILDQVKRSYPDAFNYALDLCGILENNLNININSNEVGYIAIHFATSIERAKQQTTYKAIIVCNTGMGTSELIRIKLRRYLPQIEVLGCYQVHYLEHINLEEIDFIISTINIDKPLIKDKALIKVSHVLNDDDIQNIEHELNKIYLQGYLKSLFNEKVFYNRLDVKDKNQLLEYVCSDMVNKDFISSEDKEIILNREKLSSTEISNLVAVPHCISAKNKNSIAICTLTNPINWGNARVKLVFVACLDPDKKENKHVFPFIHSRIKKGKIVNDLCESTSLENFIEILMRDNDYDS